MIGEVVAKIATLLYLVCDWRKTGIDLPDWCSCEGRKGCESSCWRHDEQLVCLVCLEICEMVKRAEKDFGLLFGAIEGSVLSSEIKGKLPRRYDGKMT